MPETTVLIPTYNCGKYVKGCIDSILTQKYTNYEILIIDDGSTDNTEDIIRGINDNRIVYLKNDKNLGIVKTLNKGIEIAKGKYIARMDADDVMLGNRLQLQVNFLEQNPDYGMVGGWFKMMNEDGKFVKDVFLETENKNLTLSLLFFNLFSHSTVTMRTEIVRQLKYKQQYIYCEDFDLWTRFSEVSKIANLPYFFLSYRWYSNNTCHLKQKELRTALALLLTRELNKLKIKHTAEELMMQMAINFGWKKIFDNENRKVQLTKWLDKIFNSQLFKDKFDEETIKSFKTTLLTKYSGVIYENEIKNLV